MTTCSVKSCKNKASKFNKLSFFRFPSDPLIMKIWIENCDLSYLLLKDPALVRKNYRVCGVHFEDKMFLNPKVKNRVTFNAVPTLFNKVIPSEEKKKQTIKKEQEFETQAFCASCFSPISEQKLNTMSSYGNTTSYHMKSETSESSSKIPLSFPNISFEKIQLLNEIEKKNEEIKDLKKKLSVTTQQLTQVNTVEQMLKLCKLHLPKSLFLFINTHINNRNKKLKESMYCNQILELAKTIYLLSSLNVYQFLQSILPLPAPCILRRTLNLNKIYPVHSDLND